MKKLFATLVLTTIAGMSYGQSLLKGQVVNANNEIVSGFTIREHNTENHQMIQSNDVFLFLLNKPSGTIVIEHKDYESKLIDFSEVLNIYHLGKIKLKAKEQQFLATN